MEDPHRRRSSQSNSTQLARFNQSLIFLQSWSISLVPIFMMSCSALEMERRAHLFAGTSASSTSQLIDRAFLTEGPEAAGAGEAASACCGAADAYMPTCLSVLERGPKNLIIGTLLLKLDLAVWTTTGLVCFDRKVASILSIRF